MAVSDRGLRVFMAAASAGSLTGAARQLDMGQPAISHSITRLEEALGTTLLERSRSGVRTTPAGHALLEQLRPAFAQIDEAVGAAQGHDDSVVSVSVSTSLASWWLLPRLPEFKRLYPEVSLRLVTADADAAVDMSALDLWIPLGRIERTDLDATVLCDEALIPVASPALAAQLGADATPLHKATLLHLEERYEPRFDWPRWFAEHGIALPDPLPGDRSNDYSLVLQAALDGQGVALGWRHIVQDLLDDGRLVALDDAVVTDTPFVILHSNRRRLSPQAEALRWWLVESMAH